MTAKIVVASDDAATCTLLRVMLEKEPRLRIVGCARNGRELALLVAEHSPHLVLVDVDTTGEGLAGAVPALKRRVPSPIFIGLLGDLSAGSPLHAHMDARLTKHHAFTALATSIRMTGSTNDDLAGSPKAVAADIGNATAHSRPHWWHLYARDLERRQRELSERLCLTEVWLSSLKGGPTTSVAQPVATIAPPPNDGMAVRPIVSLSVDGFFNAQHKVDMDGNEGTIHSHSWRVSVRVLVESTGRQVPTIGFADAKRVLRDSLSKLDGKMLNDLPQFSGLAPTSENVAAQLYNSLSTGFREMKLHLDSVTLWESPTNAITYSESVL